MRQFRFESPNYTQAPNDLFDHLLKEIDDLSELKVTLAAIRMTIGYHTDKAELGQVYLEKMTGLSRNSVRRGLALALRRGTIRIVKKSTNRQGAIYALGVNSGGSAVDPLEGQGVVPLEGQPLTPLKKERKEIKVHTHTAAADDSPDRLKAWQTLQAKFEQQGGIVGAPVLDAFIKAYEGNPDHRAERLNYALKKLDEKKNIFRAIDAYREYNPNPPPARTYPPTTGQKPARVYRFRED